MLRNPRRKRTEAHNCLGKIMIKILSDSTCDLSLELIQKYDIGIIPLYVRLAAFFGTALKIHPRIAVSDGAMHPEKKYRAYWRLINFWKILRLC